MDLHWLLLLACVSIYHVNAITQMNILVLGGDGMMGSAFVNLLLQENKMDNKYNLTLVNRGNWYWDTEETIKPFVRHAKCSRGDGFREDCTLLHDRLMYEAIIDFSCYHPLDMEDILIVFRGRFKKYIYISSDSVYEVSRNKSHNGYSVEEDAVRPVDMNLQEELNKKDSYGHHKLEGEETLHKYHVPLKYDYIALRLPDVIGPRDNTNRFWKCFIWAKLNSIIGPILIPEELEKAPLSFVYSLDVSRLVYELVTSEFKSEIYNQVYNLGFKETTTLKSFFNIMGNYVSKSPLEFSSGPLGIGFPSVTRGPVSTTKAEKMLNWRPTDILIALNETIQFYNDAQFNEEYKYILERVLDFFKVRGDKYREFVTMHHVEKAERQKVEL